MQSPDKIVIKFWPFRQSKIHMKRLSSKNISSIECDLEVAVIEINFSTPAIPA